MAASATPGTKSPQKTILARPVPASMPSASPESTSNPTYLSRVRELKLIDEKGAADFLSNGAVSLDASEQETARSILKTERTFQQNGFEFSWNLLTFLSYLVPSFTSQHVKAKVALTSGAFHCLNETFWKRRVEKKINPELLELITPEMWDFCKLEPRCYELWVTLPVPLKDDPDTVERLMHFCAYCIAIQSLPHLPTNHTKALAEFNHSYLKDVHSQAPSSSDASDEAAKARVKDVEEAMIKVKKHTLVTALPFGKNVEIFCSPQMSIKITFAFQEFTPQFLMDGFHLELGTSEEKVVATPSFPPSLGLNLVHDYWVHRFSYRESLTDINALAVAFGRFLAYQTCFGEVLNGPVLENYFRRIICGKVYDLAFESGKPYLPQGEEPLLAYYFNSSLATVPGGLQARTPLGKLLIPFLHKQPEFDSLDAVLCMVSSLMGSLVPTFRRTAVIKPGIVIRWETPAPVYLRVGLSLDEAFRKITKDPHALPLLDQVLSIFIPQLTGTPPNPQIRSGPLEEIFSRLKKEKPFSNELLNFYLFLHATGNLAKEDLHVLELPSWVARAVDRGDLETVLEKLNTIYQSSPYNSVFCAVRKQVTRNSDENATHSGEEKAKDPTSEVAVSSNSHSQIGSRVGQSQEQAAYQAILLSGERVIFLRAWAAYVKKFETDVEFLVQVAAVLDVNAFPKVVRHVSEKQVASDQDRLRLLVAFFQRLTESGFEALFDIHSQPLADQIKGLIPKCTFDVTLHLKLRECLIDPAVREMGKLRGDLATLNTQPNSWWTRFLEVQKSIKPEQQKEFDELFKDAMGYPKANLHQKKGFTEIFTRVADLEFLMKIAPTVDAGAFPVVIRHVCELNVPVEQDRLRLLVAYFQRLTGPGFESLYKEHSQLLADLIRGLNPTPQDLEANPKLKECLTDPIVRELGKLKEDLASPKKAESDLWWSRFLKVKEKLKPEHQQEFDSLFLKAMGNKEAKFDQKNGFAEIFKRIADNLLREKKYPQLISLLGQILLTRVDKIVIPRWQALLQALMDDQVPLQFWTAALNELRTSKTYQLLDRKFLVKILAHMTERFSPEDICDQIRFLRDHVKPTREEVPKLPGHLLTYYEKMTNVNPLLDDLEISLPLFVSWKEVGVTAQVQRCARLLTAEDKKNWGRFAGLLDQVRKEDLFLDGVLQVLEFLSTLPTIGYLVAGCFKTQIAQKRLNPLQKRRLAEASGLAVRKAAKGPAGEILKGVPSTSWVMDQLKNETSWQSYLRLFFHLSTPDAVDHESLRWGLPFLIASTDGDLIQKAVELLVRTPPKALNSPEWKFLAAGLAACDVANDEAGRLLSRLSLGALPEERQFYEHCHSLRQVETTASQQQCQELLSEYVKTKTIPSYHGAPSPSNGSIPIASTFQAVPAPSNGSVEHVAPVGSDIRNRITGLLSKKRITTKDLGTIRTLLVELPSTERELWMVFFKAIPENATAELLVSVWRAWVSKHPLAEVREGDEKYWVAAIDACLHRSISYEGPLANESDGFLGDVALPLLLSLSYSRELLLRCYEVGIEICWRSAREKNKQSLQTLHTLSFMPPVKEKMGEPKSFFKPTYLVQMTLLQASASEEEFYPHWHGLFIKWFPRIEIQYGDMQNSLIFTNYCTKPYVPRGQEGQRVIFEWIIKSWKVLKDSITWEGGCALLSALCQFSELSSEPLSSQLDLMWSDLALGPQLQEEAIKDQIRRTRGLAPSVPIQIAIITPNPPGPFVKMSLDVVSYLMKQTTQRDVRFARLAKMRENFLTYVERLKTQDDVLIAEFQMLWCYSVFSSPLTDPTKDVLSVLNWALLTLKSLQKKFWSKNAERALEAFSNNALPVIMGLMVPTENWFAELSDLIKGLALVPSIVDPVNRSQKYALRGILMNLCEGVSRASTKGASQFALKLFHDFMVPPPLIKKEQIPGTKQTASEVFFSSFLPIEDLKCLDEKDWEGAFSGLSIIDIKALEELAKRGTGLAVPRLLRWTKPPTFESLSEQVDACLELGIPYLYRCNPAKGDLKQLHILAEWIHALCAIQAKCAAYSGKKAELKLETLSILKTGVIKEFVSHLFTCIQDEKSYFICSDLYLALADRDPETLRAICASFTIGQHLPLWIQNRLHMFKEILESRANDLPN